jgi:hypothetical protein
MKGVELSVSQKGCCRKIAISLNDQRSKREIACLQQSRPDCGCVTDNPWDSSFLDVQLLPLYGGHNT